MINIRNIPLILVAIALLVSLLSLPHPVALFSTVIFGMLTGVGLRDITQKQHALNRNYPIAGHLRTLIESVRPQIRQYLMESDTDGMPFNREERSIVYQRAKDQEDKKPFGTELDIYGAGYEWINHSIAPSIVKGKGLELVVGSEQCLQPYSMSRFNISAMSFGSLGANAVAALNKGAKLGGFTHDSGEGGVSRYHREQGGDLIWEIGSGYFGCRNAEGGFDPDRFAQQASSDQVKMIELKLSQGAKPGQGGMLPGAKVTAEIAQARGVLIGSDCLSPAGHSAFSTPLELVQFLGSLRKLSSGKPVGFKLCIGHRWEFMAIVKAMLETGITPDFIVIDGSEGGTGAAPAEFSDHVGTPLREGLVFAHNVLVGSGLRRQIKIGVSGKVITGFDIAANLALGADWCNSGRGFMFALGCVQSQHCHTGHCPTGIATQDPSRQLGLDVDDKAVRVAEFHKETIKVLGKIISSAGLSCADELRPEHLSIRLDTDTVAKATAVYPYLKPNALLENEAEQCYQQDWGRAQAGSFNALRASL